MAATDEIRLPPDLGVAGLWPAVAAATQHWLAQNQVAPGDAVVLLPFAALLGPARAAYAALGGWQPRIETTLTLAAALGPPPVHAPLSCTGDANLDRLHAGRLLRRHPWAAQWERSDRMAFEHAVQQVVAAAQSMREAALVVPPALRRAWWDAAHARIRGFTGVPEAEAALLAFAAQWAADDTVAGTDRLFALRPAAWVAVRLGGADALADAVLADAQAPTLRIELDPGAQAPFAGTATPQPLQRWLCDDAEAEAHATACTVIEALYAGRQPVAVVALDRALVRRVGALLQRARVPLLDETGWRLSTTRAAARLLGLLQAASRAASRDERVDWLKTWPPAAPEALAVLEARWRGQRVRGEVEAALRLEQRAEAFLARLQTPPMRELGGWLGSLRELLVEDGTHAELEADDAGRQVLDALGLRGPVADGTHVRAAGDWRLDLATFTRWVGSVLEESSFLPVTIAAAPVVLTPLARAIGRPFGQVVVPGADHRLLGDVAVPGGLIGPAAARALGLPDPQLQRTRQRLALAQLLRTPALTLLRRHHDDEGDAVVDSPDLQWLLLTRAAEGHPEVPLRTWEAPHARHAAMTVPRPAPTAADRLPARLSASQLQALRDCPYRFFARAVLRLEEAPELEAELAKRDYGNWLHEVLHAFHLARAAEPAEGLHAADARRLDEAAAHATRRTGFDEAALLPYRAGFEALAPAYLAWLHAREDAGWRWHAGEDDRERDWPPIAPTRLYGRIDRLDLGPGGTRELIDYKTSRVEDLRRRVRAPLDEPQLLLYAALLGVEGSLSATYLALDGERAPEAVEQDNLAEGVAILLEQLGQEWARLRAGAGLPALGEPPTCDWCEARGLCRRDQWSAP